MHDFVILHHVVENGASHWDLMLHDGAELLTWALENNPLKNRRVRGQQLTNHRIEYLSFEGEISGNRGTVKQIARGQFEWVEQIDSKNWTILMSTEKDLAIECSLAKNCEFEFSTKPIE